MQSKFKRLVLAAAVVASGTAFFASAASAQTASTTYMATLDQANGSGGSGSLVLALDGDQATITEHVTGLADQLPASLKGGPYPHVQHIHIDGQGTCPATAQDTNKDGIISTTEGLPNYGPIGTSLTTSGDTSPAAGTALNVAPTGATFDYSRTFTIDAKTKASLMAGKAVIVVHGLDPAKTGKAGLAKSDLVPALPLAATSPALCGTLVATQATTWPTGGPATGGGSTSGVQDVGLLLLGGGLVVSAGVALTVRRRTSIAS
jgi:hypothetical protein